MKKIFCLLFIGMALSACKKEENQISMPSDISNVSVEPRVGGAVVKWTLPQDSNFLYAEVRYTKKGEIVKTNVSKYTDSLLVTGLLNKLDYTFEIQTFNKDLTRIEGGTVLTTSAVKPIRRSIQTVYLPLQLTKLAVTNAMIQTYTQESTEGHKENLVDENKSTYWHSAWSAGVQPLPHWITITYKDITSMGAIKYYFRQNASANGRPTQFALDKSNDGITWTRVWTSSPNLSTSTAVANEITLPFDKNYQAKYFKLLVLATQGNTTYVTLGDMSFHTMGEELTDLEEIEENNY
ncbi:DUF4959 domain-containing protein [Pedobacter immunditicola]|uniref:DUF4959 domain-containing protein n=1 Tax=Pedobacter immunditicola TaxID=3133440 RepID=UPI0030971AF4